MDDTGTLDYAAHAAALADDPAARRAAFVSTVSQAEGGAAAVAVPLTIGGFAEEDRALGVLQRCGGASVHAHTIARHWGVADVPLHDVQPDPFLEREVLS
jgi:hypothetical protein